jgi:hypothetical protein
MTQNPMYPPQPPGMPGGPAYGYPQPPMQQANGFAIAGLIFSIIGLCVPILSGLIGLILGIVGLAKTRNPAVGGKGLSIAAIIIGALTLIGWTVFVAAAGVGGFAMFKGSSAARATARTFVQDLASGNVAAAQANATSDLSSDDVTALSTRVKKLGAFIDMTSFAVNIQDVNGKKTCHLTGNAQFSGGSSAYEIDLVADSSGWKVSGATFR